MIDLIVVHLTPATTVRAHVALMGFVGDACVSMEMVKMVKLNPNGGDVCARERATRAYFMRLRTVDRHSIRQNM